MITKLIKFLIKMNSITQKIQDVYVLYNLCDKNISETLKLTKLSRITLTKYITIQERLDFSLLENLDKKGNDKLTLDLALHLCNFALNPDFQINIYPKLIQETKKLRKNKIEELSECLICCDSSSLFERLPCCNKFICDSCLVTMIDTNVNDLAFTGVKCPFCHVYFTIDQIDSILRDRYDSKELWRQNKKYYKTMKFNTMYSQNLYYKFINIISCIEHVNNHALDNNSNDLKSLLGDEFYFGSCPSCTPTINDNQSQRRRFNRLRIGKVEKQCVNDQNQIVVLEPNMFLCVVCKSHLEDPNDGEFKKCPHCGIKTVKPDGCNFIYCDDHRWCFICNERIENNEDGHNKHYHTGPGTSPYSNQCRQSIDYDAPKFLIKGKCNCNSCKQYGGAPLCRTLECMNRTSQANNPIDENEIEFHTYCEECRLHL